MRAAIWASVGALGALVVAVVALLSISTASGHAEGPYCWRYGAHVHVGNRVIWGS